MIRVAPALATDCHVMSNIRHHIDRDDTIVRTMSIEFSSGYHWRLNGMDWGVLVWASRGVSTVTIEARVWVIAPYHALWIPAGVAHAVRMTGRGTLRQGYVAPEETRAFPVHPRVLAVDPLLREVLRRVCKIEALQRASRAQHRLLEPLADEVKEAGDGASMHRHLESRELPMPADGRARRAADAVRSHARRTPVCAPSNDSFAPRRGCRSARGDGARA